jgi:hypothetical protein
MIVMGVVSFSSDDMLWCKFEFSGELKLLQVASIAFHWRLTASDDWKNSKQRPSQRQVKTTFLTMDDPSTQEEKGSTKAY